MASLSGTEAPDRFAAKNMDVLASIDRGDSRQSQTLNLHTVVHSRHYIEIFAFLYSRSIAAM
jgi:hypothetical protein